MAYVTFAAISKLVAGTATHPWIVIRTRMQDHFHEYKGFRDVLYQTWRCIIINIYNKNLINCYLNCI